MSTEIRPLTKDGEPYFPPTVASQVFNEGTGNTVEFDINKLNSDLAKLAFEDIDFPSIALNTTGNTIDLASINSKLTTTNYKRIDVDFVDQNNIGSYAMGSVTCSNGKWFVRATATSAGYFNIKCRCWIK